MKAAVAGRRAVIRRKRLLSGWTMEPHPGAVLSKPTCGTPEPDSRSATRPIEAEALTACLGGSPPTLRGPAGIWSAGRTNTARLPADSVGQGATGGGTNPLCFGLEARQTVPPGASKGY